MEDLNLSNHAAFDLPMKVVDPSISTNPASPIEDLRQILLDAGEDVLKIFGPAISTYAGPFSAGQTPAEKRSALERLLTE